MLASVCSTEAVSTVYNLRVADHHTYFVGGSIWGWDVWVHNSDYTAVAKSIRRNAARMSNPKQRIQLLDVQGGHSFADHGAQVTRQQHLTRLQTGVTPSGRNAAIPDTSSSFASDLMHLRAYEKALAEFWSSPDLITPSGKLGKKVVAVFDLVGAGVSHSLKRGQLNSEQANTVRAIFKLTPNGDYRLHTMFPEVT